MIRLSLARSSNDVHPTHSVSRSGYSAVGRSASDKPIRDHQYSINDKESLNFNQTAEYNGISDMAGIAISYVSQLSQKSASRAINVYYF